VANNWAKLLFHWRTEFCLFIDGEEYHSGVEEKEFWGVRFKSMMYCFLLDFSSSDGEK